MTACKRAEDLAQYALSYGWTAEVEYGTDYEGDEYVDVSMSWSDANAWAIGAGARWYRMPKGSWRMAGLDGAASRPIACIAEWIPDGTNVDFTLSGVTLLRRYIADRTDLVSWLNGERMRKRFAEQSLKIAPG